MTKSIPQPRFPPLSTSLETFLNDGCDASFRQTIYGLLQVSALMLKAREHYGAAIGLTGPQYSMLVAVAEAGETTVTDLATTLHVSSPYITSEVKKLVRLGYVGRRPNAKDGRSSLLFLTPDGRDRVHRVSDIRRAGNDIIFGALNTREARSLEHLVRVLVRDLEKAVHMLEAPHWREDGRNHPEPPASYGAEAASGNL